MIRTVLALLLLSTSIAGAAEKATYVVTLDATWSARTHPHDYPSSAHFSWLIGATTTAAIDCSSRTASPRRG